MRTTIDLPDDLFRQAKVRAALSGLTLKELFTRWVERGLLEGEASPPAAGRQQRSLPQIIAARGRRMPALSNIEIEALIEAEDAGIRHDRPD